MKTIDTNLEKKVKTQREINVEYRDKYLAIKLGYVYPSSKRPNLTQYQKYVDTLSSEERYKLNKSFYNDKRAYEKKVNLYKEMTGIERDTRQIMYYNMYDNPIADIQGVVGIKAHKNISIKDNEEFLLEKLKKDLKGFSLLEKTKHRKKPIKSYFDKLIEQKEKGKITLKELYKKIEKMLKQNEEKRKSHYKYNPYTFEDSEGNEI